MALGSGPVRVGFKLVGGFVAKSRQMVGGFVQVLKFPKCDFENRSKGVYENHFERMTSVAHITHQTSLSHGNAQDLSIQNAMFHSTMYARREESQN